VKPQKNIPAVLEKVSSINIPGFVNGLAFSTPGNILAAATGQEHRLGRWARIPKVKNGIAIIKLGANTAQNTKNECNSINGRESFFSTE